MDNIYQKGHAMAKRYHNSKKMMEKRVPATVKNDYSQFANLPTQVIMEDYPSCGYMDQMLDDSIIGIDRQMEGDVNTARKQMSRKKY